MCIRDRVGVTIFLASQKPTKMAADISPIEALGYRPTHKTVKERKAGKGKVIARLSLEQVTKDKKRTAVVLLSLAASLSVYLCIVTMLDSQAARTIVSNYMDTDMVIKNDTACKEKSEDRRDILDESFVKSIKAVSYTHLIELAVKGMLPKGPLGRTMYKKLFVYAGPEHKHEAQKPETLTFY